MSYAFSLELVRSHLKCNEVVTFRMSSHLQVRLQIANLKTPTPDTVDGIAENLRGTGERGTGRDQASLKHIFRRIQFFYRGSLPPLMTTGLVQSLNFSGFEAVKRTLHPDPTTPAPLPVFWAAGCGGTLFVTLITCPTQRIKILQQSSTKGVLISDVFYDTCDLVPTSKHVITTKYIDT